MGFFRKSPDLGYTPLQTIPRRTAEDVAAEQELGREFTVDELRERHTQKEREQKTKELTDKRKKREAEERAKKDKKKKQKDSHDNSVHGNHGQHAPEAHTHHDPKKEHGDHGHEKKEKKPGVGNFEVGKYLLLKAVTDFHKAAKEHKVQVDHHDVDEYRNIKESVSSLNKESKEDSLSFVNARLTTLVHHKTKDTQKFERDFFISASKFFPEETGAVLFDTQKKEILKNIFQEAEKSVETKEEKEALQEAYKEFTTRKADTKKIVDCLEVKSPSFPFRLARTKIIEILSSFYPSEKEPKKKKIDELYAAVDFFSNYREVEQKLFVEKQEREKTKKIDRQLKNKPLPTKTGGFIYKILNPDAAPFVHSKTNFPKMDGGTVGFAIEFPEISPREMNLVDLIMNILEEYKQGRNLSQTTQRKVKAIQNQIKDGVLSFRYSTPSLDRLIKAFLNLDFDEVEEEEKPHDEEETILDENDIEAIDEMESETTLKENDDLPLEGEEIQTEEAETTLKEDERETRPLTEAELDELIERQKPPVEVEAKSIKQIPHPTGHAEVEEAVEEPEFIDRENFPVTIGDNISGQYTGPLKLQKNEERSIYVPDTTGTEKAGIFLFSYNNRPYKLEGEFKDGKIIGEVNLFYDIVHGLSIEYSGAVNEQTLLPESEDGVAFIKTINDDSYSERSFRGRFVNGKMDVKNGKFDPPFQQSSGEIFLNRITGETIGGALEKDPDDLPDVDVHALPPLEETGPLPGAKKEDGEKETSEATDTDFIDLDFGEDEVTSLNNIRPSLSPEAAEAVEDLIKPAPENPPLLSDSEVDALVNYQEQKEQDQKQKREQGLRVYEILNAFVVPLLPILPDSEQESIQDYMQKLETVEPTDLIEYLKENPLLDLRHKTGLYKYLRQELQKGNPETLEKDLKEIAEQEEIQNALKKVESEKKDSKLEYLKTEVTRYLSLLIPLYHQDEKEDIQKIIETLSEFDAADTGLFQIYSEVMTELQRELTSTNSKLYVHTIKILEQFGRTKDVDILRRHFEAILNNHSVKTALSRPEKKQITPTVTVKPAPPIRFRSGERVKTQIGKFIAYMKEMGLGEEAATVLENDGFRKKILDRTSGSIPEHLTEILRDEINLTKERLIQSGIPQADIDNIPKIKIIYGEENPNFRYYELLDKIKRNFNFKTGR